MSSAVLEKPGFMGEFETFDWEDSEELGAFVESGAPTKTNWIVHEIGDRPAVHPSVDQRRMGVGSKNGGRLLPPISDQIEHIIKALSLTITQTARILDVARPTIYEWRKSEGDGNLTEANRRRLSKIFDIAKTWEGYGKGPIGTKVMIPFIDDHRSLLDDLVSDELDMSRIKNRMRLLAEEPNKDVLVGQREARWREALREQGYEEPSEEEKQANLEDNLRALYYEY